MSGYYSSLYFGTRYHGSRYYQPDGGAEPAPAPKSGGDFSRGTRIDHEEDELILMLCAAFLEIVDEPSGLL